jgi:ubiquinone/menaquinone biosynthesis C-methylase UbiE
LHNSESAVLTPALSGGLPVTIADRTRRIYDRLAAVYPVSTFFFHSRAHRHALALSGLRDGMRVLEVATGSGEMFRHLVRANPSGETHGVDLSPNMAKYTHRRIQREFPNASALCQAVDARHMPFCDRSFDAVVCCYLFELLAVADIVKVLREFRRILRDGGTLTLVCIGQNTKLFNLGYRLAAGVLPQFWGRQVETRVPGLLDAAGFQIDADQKLRQGFYPSRVLIARK